MALVEDQVFKDFALSLTSKPREKKHWTSRELSSLFESQTGVHYSASHWHRLLREKRISFACCCITCSRPSSSDNHHLDIIHLGRCKGLDYYIHNDKEFMLPGFLSLDQQHAIYTAAGHTFSPHNHSRSSQIPFASPCHYIVAGPSMVRSKMSFIAEAFSLFNKLRKGYKKPSLIITIYSLTLVVIT